MKTFYIGHSQLLCQILVQRRRPEMFKMFASACPLGGNKFSAIEKGGG